MRDRRKSVFSESDTVTYVPVQIHQPSRAKRHRLKWSERMIRKHQLNRIKCVDEEVQARLNAEIAAKSSFDAGVAAAAAAMRSYEGSSASAGAFSSGASAFVGGSAAEVKRQGAKNKNSKPEKVKKPKKKVNKKVIKWVAIVLAILIGISAIGVGTVAALNNFLFFPDADEALENALESKIDLGTKFDISDLLDRGKIEVQATGVSELGLEAEKFNGTLTYTKNAASLNALLDNQEFNFVYTDKGVAFNAQKFESDKYYGASFKDLVAQVEGSFLNPESDSVNSLSEYEYEEFLETVKDLEAVRENEKEYEKAAETVLEAIEKAFEESTLSEYETNYGGLTVFGEVRSARCRIYSFDNGDLLDFATKLAATFENPDAKLSEAVDKLLAVEEFRYELEDRIGASLENCDEVAEMLADTVELLEAMDEPWSAKLVLAYVGRAFTAIQLRVATEDGETLVVIDFGEHPSRDRDLVVEIETKDNSGATNTLRLDYGVEKADGKSVATFSVGMKEREDAYSADYDKTTYRYSFTFDDAAGKASLKATEETEYLFGGDEPIVDSSDMFEVIFKLDDSYTSLTLELDKIIGAFGEEEEIDLDYKITLSKFYGWIKLPEYENVLLMDADDYDDVYSDFDEYYTEFIDSYVGGFDISDLLSGIELPDLALPEIDLGGNGGSGGNKPSGNKPGATTGISSGSYVYEDGTGYKDIYFLNNGSYTYKSYNGDELLYDEIGTYEAYSDRIVFYPGDAEEYELSVDGIEANELVLDGMSYFRQ